MIHHIFTKEECESEWKFTILPLRIGTNLSITASKTFQNKPYFAIYEYGHVNVDGEFFKIRTLFTDKWNVKDGIELYPDLDDSPRKSKSAINKARAYFLDLEKKGWTVDWSKFIV